MWRLIKPDGYSRQKAKELLDSYAGTDDNSANNEANKSNTAANSDYPNIIVVMDEAFSDLSVLGDFDTNTTICRLCTVIEKGNENTITGYLNTSVCGGNTADTEFEFLTGNTMAFSSGRKYSLSAVYKEHDTFPCKLFKKHRLRNVCTASVLWQWMEPGYGLSSFGI